GSRGPGGGLPEGDGAEGRGPLPLPAGPGRRPGALAGRRAGLGLPRAIEDAAGPVGTATPGAGGVGGRATRRGSGGTVGWPRPAGSQASGGRAGAQRLPEGEGAGGGDQQVPRGGLAGGGDPGGVG